MSRSAIAVLTSLLSIAAWGCTGETSSTDQAGYAGSLSCIGCHERFYDLWAPSRHGLAMQPFTAEFAATEIGPQSEAVAVGSSNYRFEMTDAGGWVFESTPYGTTEHRIEHAMGGKNIYFFLTELDGGRLQVLPIAYDVRRRAWYNATASMVRHFPDLEDEPLDWRDPELTFNTSCYGCHVSQLSTNYDLETGIYHTVWVEPGINCETCHGPAGEHVRVCGTETCPEDMAIISTKEFTAAQTNAMCAPCHAKMRPLTSSFLPGDRYFDHYDLVTLEHPDFYPDGRDLGENFTYTLWLMSPCLAGGQIDCLHCHTSSGRYRFTDERANDACLPCHEARVRDAPAHTRHPDGSAGNRCVVCHMPMTEFARMRRTDHSMRPPTPAATLEFDSPNACNLCHGDRDAAWADRRVREWHPDDYQAEALQGARLIGAARGGNWARLSEMLAYLESANRDAVFAASLVRVLEAADDDRTWPVLARLLRTDPSPLVRGSAATALRSHLTPETAAALLAATRDDYRLVRVRAADALAGYPPERVPPGDRRTLDQAYRELEAAMRSRPDDFFSHYSLGNYHLARGELGLAILEYELALRIAPRFVPALVNLSMAHARLGDSDEAELSLRRALEVDSSNAAAHLNLGLLLLEEDATAQAEQHLRAAYQADSTFAAPAYNLCVLLAEDRIDEALEWCRRASHLDPDDARHPYTLAYYLYQQGDTAGALGTLRELLRRHPTYADALDLLTRIYEETGADRETQDRGR